MSRPQAGIKWLLLAGVLLWLLAQWRCSVLPPPQQLRPELLQEPLQRPTARQPFVTTVGGIEYTVKPLYEYELFGLVVSKHDADSWLDWYHADTRDRLNTNDLCVVWGANARSGIYRELSITSGNYVCEVQAASAETYAAFDPAALANNHMLTDQRRWAKLLSSLQVGDQIHFRGVLAEYSHHHGFAYSRGSSTSRTDTGNGACEVVFVEEVEVLDRANRGWRLLRNGALLLVLTALVAWFAVPIRVR